MLQGALMSCKGLVELIVLNIGLQAKILTQRTFTMFVVMALVTTFATTPLTSALYPPHYQRKLEAWKRGEINWDGTPGPEARGESIDDVTLQKLESSRVKRMLVYLRLDNMPTLLSFVSLLGNGRVDAVAKRHPTLTDANSTQQSEASTLSDRKAPLAVHGVRLIELTERSSAVMKVSEVEEYTLFDPVLNAFRILGQLYNNLAISGEVAVVPETSYGETLVSKASEEGSDLLLLPWSETGNLNEAMNLSHDCTRNRMGGNAYRQFVSRTLEDGITNTAVFVNRRLEGSVQFHRRPSTLTRVQSGPREHLTSVPRADRSHHIFLPFFGGADSRVALRLVLQLAENPAVTATIVHYRSTALEEVQATTVVEYTKDATRSPQPGLSSITRSSVPERSEGENDTAFFATLQRSLPSTLEGRVLFDSVVSEAPLEGVLDRAALEFASSSFSGVGANGFVVVPRRAAALGHVCEALRGAGEGVEGDAAASCLGPLADAVLERGVGGSLLVVRGRNGAEGI